MVPGRSATTRWFCFRSQPCSWAMKTTGLLWDSRMGFALDGGMALAQPPGFSELLRPILTLGIIIAGITLSFEAVNCA